MLFRLSEVTKSYGGTEILKGVSFQVNVNERVGLVGRNGAGKTTVFRLVTGAESADSGEVIKMNGLKLGLLDQHVDFGSGETVHTAALSAFKEIHDIEAEMRRVEKQMETDHSAEVLDKYADLQTAFEQADGFTYAARAEAILLGIGFPVSMWQTDTGTLSGGQKNRLGMARLLLSSADILLLDEPTNHLDVEGVEWLENYLKESGKTYVVISHDRYFLDRTTDRVIEIDRGRAVSYRGNYTDYLEERELRREQQQREYENQQQMINKTEEFIRRNLEGQKTKQAKSRRTLLARMDRIEAVAAERSGGNFGLKEVERTGNNVLTAEDLSIGYETLTLAEGLNFTLHRGEALGIIGANGTGKTTLLRTLLGELRELSGEVRWGTKTNIGYYSQNLTDLEPRNEVIQELRRVAPMADNNTLRGFLAKFLFTGDDVFKNVGDLSGGEKGRLALAKLIYSQKNVLVLDEPTNHLDIPSRESLESALKEYTGTIVTVSHDRFFLDKIATQILSFERDGEVLNFNGNYSEFHAWKSSLAPAGKDAAEAVNATPAEPPDEPKNSAGLSKNEFKRRAGRMEAIETEISELEASLSDLGAEMGSAETAASPKAFKDLSTRYRDTEEKIRLLYSEWETLAEQIA